MKAEEAGTAAGSDDARERGEELVELVELAVHRDTERLKRAGSGVDAADADGAKKLIAFGESKPDAKLDAIELATWTMLANELFNLDEVLTK